MACHEYESSIALPERPTIMSGIAWFERVTCHESESDRALSDRSTTRSGMALIYDGYCCV